MFDYIKTFNFNSLKIKNRCAFSVYTKLKITRSDIHFMYLYNKFKLYLILRILGLHEKFLFKIYK